MHISENSVLYFRKLSGLIHFVGTLIPLCEIFNLILSFVTSMFSLSKKTQDGSFVTCMFFWLGASCTRCTQQSWDSPLVLHLLRILTFKSRRVMLSHIVPFPHTHLTETVCSSATAQPFYSLKKFNKIIVTKIFIFISEGPTNIENWSAD